MGQLIKALGRHGIAAIAACLPLFAATAVCSATEAGTGHASPSSEDSWVVRYQQIRRQTNEACREERLQDCMDGLQGLLLLVDGRPDIRCQAAAVAARLGRHQAAVDDFSVCARSQLDYAALISAASLQALRALPEVRAIEESAPHGAPPAAHEVSYRFNDPELLTEDLAYNPLDHSFLVSSIRERKILRIARDGRSSDLFTSGDFPMWAVFALQLDSQRQILWATTGAVPQSPPYTTADDGRTAVLQIDLRSRALLARYELSDGIPHTFGDMTLGKDGDVFVADGRGGGVYHVRPGHGSVEVVVRPGLLMSPQTPALSSDGHTLLVPDYARGVARVDLRTQTISWIGHSAELALYGIDGFYWRSHTLIAVQNGTVPERILLMTLDARCRAVSAWRVLLAGTPGLGDPTHGVVLGRYFYFLANSGWDHVDDDGRLSEQASAPAQTWRLKLPAEAVSPAECAAAQTG